MNPFIKTPNFLLVSTLKISILKLVDGSLLYFKLFLYHLHKEITLHSILQDQGSLSKLKVSPDMVLSKINIDHLL